MRAEGRGATGSLSASLILAEVLSGARLQPTAKPDSKCWMLALNASFRLRCRLVDLKSRIDQPRQAESPKNTKN